MILALFLLAVFALAGFYVHAAKQQRQPPAVPLPAMPDGVTMPEPFTAWVGIERVGTGTPGVGRWTLTLRHGAPAEIEWAFNRASELDDLQSGIGGSAPDRLIQYLVSSYHP